MLASRCARLSLTTFVSLVPKKSASHVTYRTNEWLSKGRSYAAEAGRASSLRKVKSQTIKERLTAPAGDSAFAVGKGVLAGASLLGIGALCYYGLGLSKEVGAVDKIAVWPQIVRDRIRDTYMYFGGSLVVTASSAVAISRIPSVMHFMASRPFVTLACSLVAMVGSGMLCQSIPYEGGFGAKQLAWLVHSAVIGAVIAPMTLLGGPIMIRAAWYTAGIVGGLSTLAVCAPSEKFLNMGGPLAMGLGVVFISSIGTWFLPPTTVLGAGLMSVAVYGGLALFGLFLLYDTQKIIHRAENHPQYGSFQQYDPVNNSVGIYLDTVNIFIRVAMILSGSGGGRRK